MREFRVRGVTYQLYVVTYLVRNKNEERADAERSDDNVVPIDAEPNGNGHQTASTSFVSSYAPPESEIDAHKRDGNNDREGEDADDEPIVLYLERAYGARRAPAVACNECGSPTCENEGDKGDHRSNHGRNHCTGE
jgi:hypothetical protein